MTMLATRRGFSLTLLASTAVGMAPGCHRSAPGRSPSPSSGGYPGVLMSTESMDRQFLARQKVVVRHQARTHAFDAVLQVHEGELTLIGLSPMGTKAFVLRQRGREVQYTPHFDIPMPFPPKYILLDIHRTFFIGIPGAPLSDGTHTHRRHGEQIVERWHAGLLERRQFRRLDREPPGLIDIEYGDGMALGRLPEHIGFDNGWFGYRLRIETLDHQSLS